MTPERWVRVREIFAAALAEPAERRSAFLRDACAGDLELQAEVQALLASHREAGSFIEQPARFEATEVGGAPEVEVATTHGRTIGGYRVVRRIGEGGMGIVYEAEQEHPRRRVALKVIRGGLADERRLRLFEREMQALARLRHPAIAAIYQAGQTDDGEPFFAMELAHGATLGEAMRGGGPAAAGLGALPSRLHLFVKICEAVNYAHQRGVVHRDLKPANILVGLGPESASGGGGPLDVKILDFGLARVTDPDVVASLLTQAGAVQGTLAYMSPEQARGNPDEIDLRTDVYSLGVILYELVSGALPYDVTDRPHFEALRMICDQPPVALRQRTSADGRVPGRVARDLETIILKALEKEPGRRYQSALALAEDIERHLSDQPILARAPSTVYQLGKLARRHRAAVGFLAGTFVLVSTAAVLMTVQRNRARAAEENARTEAARATAITEFLRSILASGDPRRMGRDARVLDVLDDAARRLDTGLQGQPAVEAALRDTLSEAFYYLGQYDRAEQQARIATQIHERVSSRDGAATLKSLDNVARALIGKGKFPEAEKIVREVVDRRTRSLGLRTPETLRSMGTLSAALLGEERNAEAEAVCRQMLEAAEGVLPLGDDTRLDLLNDLGLALRRQEKLAEAETVLRKAVDESTRLRGETHPDTLASMTNLANVLSVATKYDEAEAVGRKTFEIKTRVLGPAHAETVVAQSSLGTILCRQKKPEGEQVFRSLMAVVEQPTFQSRYPLAYYHDRLGWCLGELGEYPESERLLLSAHAGLAATLGPGHAWTQLVVSHLVRLYQNWKRPAQASVWQAKVAAKK